MRSEGVGSNSWKFNAKARSGQRFAERCGSAFGRYLSLRFQAFSCLQAEEMLDAHQDHLCGERGEDQPGDFAQDADSLFS